MQHDTPHPDTIDGLKQLIAFDTTSRNSNLALIDWAEAHLARHGARIRRSYNPERTKAHLFATFGEGPGGVVLSGHTDVVPVDGQAWSTDPFQADIRDGRLFGRGACDMKGFIGVVLAQSAAFAQAALRSPIHVALSFDEEVGCLGIEPLLSDLALAGIRPDGCIVGEPTSMQMVTAHKGGRVYRCTVHGRAAHSSLTPRGVKAASRNWRSRCCRRARRPRCPMAPRPVSSSRPVFRASCAGRAASNMPTNPTSLFHWRSWRNVSSSCAGW